MPGIDLLTEYLALETIHVVEFAFLLREISINKEKNASIRQF